MVCISFVGRRCNHVSKDVNDSFESLTMDGQLHVPDELMAEIKSAQGREERGVVPCIVWYMCKWLKSSQHRQGRRDVGGQLNVWCVA